MTRADFDDMIQAAAPTTFCCEAPLLRYQILRPSPELVRPGLIEVMAESCEVCGGFRLGGIVDPDVLGLHDALLELDALEKIVQGVYQVADCRIAT